MEQENKRLKLRIGGYPIYVESATRSNQDRLVMSCRTNTLAQRTNTESRVSGLLSNCVLYCTNTLGGFARDRGRVFPTEAVADYIKCMFPCMTCVEDDSSRPCDGQYCV